MKELYFYPGRFQPMGPHHAETFNTVMSKYGAENSYIVTSNKVDFSLKGGVPKSPLNFQEKKAIMVAHGIPGNNIVQVSNPYYVKEVLFNYKPEEVEAVYLVGAKDMAENPRFKKTEGVTKEGYKWRIEVVPHVDKCIGGEEMCGTSTRVALKKGDEKTFKDIMGWFDQDIFNILKKKLNNKDIEEDLYNPEDKVNDYMRGSEWKAGMPDGPKDDKTSPVIKYNRGGMYSGGGMGAGGMYEGEIQEDGGGESELHIYDFDDTVAQVKTNIRVTITSPKGDYEKILDVPSDKFPKVSAEMEAKFSMMNFDYDFSEFEKDIEDAIISSEVLSKLKASLSNPSVQTTILTARTEGEPVINFFKGIGLDPYIIPLGSMVGGKRVTGQDKADWIEKRINNKKGIKKVYFIDDSAENRKAVYTLRDNNPEIEFSIETPPIIKEDTASDIKTIEGAFKNVFKALNVDSADVGTNEFTELINKLKGTGENWNKQLEVIAQWFKDIADKAGINLDEMIGMMTKQEKAKHAKNMKRLSKDMSNMKGDNHGGGGHKVPDYVKGTLTRKLYETKYGGHALLEPYQDKIEAEYGKQKYRELQLMVSQQKDEDVETWIKTHMPEDPDDFPPIDKAIKPSFRGKVLKKNENYPPYKANQVQQTRYKASDVFTRDVKKAEKMGYKEGTLTKAWWKKIIKETLLTEGGAAGHMNHPFDDRDLTFAEMKELVSLSLQGKLNIEADVTEKTDGQNLAVTFKNGKVGAARNKATIREPMDINAVASKFEGRGDIEKAFTFSMKDLESALNKLSPETLSNIFQNGKRFLNIEIIYPATKNVITYGPKAYIQFHGVDEYNLETATKGESFPEFAPQLQKLIANVNANIQQTFEIIPPRIITTKAVRDFDKKEPNYINRINKLQQEFGLKDSDEVVMYHQKWWEKKINEEFPRATDEEKQALVRRWAYFEKKFRLRGIQDEETRQKAIDFDKTNFQQQNKENVYQFEKIFLELGTDVLSNIDSYLAINPKDSVKELRKDIRDVIKQIQSTNDLEVLNKLKYQLKRIEDMGGFDKLVPSEGIVFIYKGKTYKLTGLFAAVNQLLGLTKYV